MNARNRTSPTMPANAGMRHQRWRIDMIENGRRTHRFVWLSNRANEITQRWWWKADTGLVGEGGGDATLHWASREYDSAELALANAQRVILYDCPFAVILSAKLSPLQDEPTPAG